MAIYDVKPKWKEAWDKLPFTNFPENYFKQGRKEEHMREAAKCLNLLQAGDVGLTADTGTGKTVMASLVIIAEEFRTLFLTSRIGLTDQHHELFSKITGNSKKSRYICGEVPKRKRIWDDPKDLVIFATPHVVIREIAKGKIDLQLFDLIVFDEMHNADEYYPYTTIARVASMLDKIPHFLSLSATPGDQEEKVDAVEKNLSIDHWQVAGIKTPHSPSDSVLAEPDETMKEIDNLFKEVLHETAVAIQQGGFEVDPDKIITWSELEWIARENNSIYGCSDFYKNILNIAKYRKLYYAYTAALTESYSTFLDYCYKKLSQDRSRSAMEILKNMKFRKIVSLAQKNLDNHPKVNMLLQVLAGAPLEKKSVIIFVTEKRTGDYFEKILSKKGCCVETIYGGIGKSRKKQNVTLKKLKSGEIDYLISTSVIEEGLNVSEVKAVVHYSMPKTGVSRKQRGGRTGRLEKGHIIFIILNHRADTALYWSTAQKVKRIDKIIAEKAGLAAEKKLKPPKKKSGTGKKDNLTLPLF